MLKLTNTSILNFALAFFLSSNFSAQTFNIGHSSVDFFDTSRDRTIGCEIYYPAESSGEDVAVSAGNFPLLVFGHGFLMSWDSYENIWTELVSSGYVICFATTEMGIAPSHEDFGLDLKFIAAQMQIENDDISSFFYNTLTPKTSIMGHSMGGGASFLAAENNTSIQALVNFAAAETNPSAINAALNIEVPSLLFSGEDDCITPPEEHQDIMYGNLNSSCKTQINIINGSHCYFANENIACDFGEAFCNPDPNISREEQHSVINDFLLPWLNYTLKDDQDAFTLFNDSLQSSNRINYSQFCDEVKVQNHDDLNQLQFFPNPTEDYLNLVLPEDSTDGILFIYNGIGAEIYEEKIVRREFQISLSELAQGTYFLVYLKESKRYTGKILKGNNR